MKKIYQFINTVEDDTKSTLNRGALSLSIPTRPHKGFSVLHSSRQSETSPVQVYIDLWWSFYSYHILNMRVFQIMFIHVFEQRRNRNVHTCWLRSSKNCWKRSFTFCALLELDSFKIFSVRSKFIFFLQSKERVDSKKNLFRTTLPEILNIVK